jgi:hypothetical protein
MMGPHTHRATDNLSAGFLGWKPDPSRATGRRQARFSSASDIFEARAFLIGFVPGKISGAGENSE